MSDNSYWKHPQGMLTKSENTSLDTQLIALGWTRINRTEYRRLVREQARSHDYRATGEMANEVEGE